MLAETGLGKVRLPFRLVYIRRVCILSEEGRNNKKKGIYYLFELKMWHFMINFS